MHRMFVSRRMCETHKRASTVGFRQRPDEDSNLLPKIPRFKFATARRSALGAAFTFALEPPTTAISLSRQGPLCSMQGGAAAQEKGGVLEQKKAVLKSKKSPPFLAVPLFHQHARKGSVFQLVKAGTDLQHECKWSGSTQEGSVLEQERQCFGARKGSVL